MAASSLAVFNLAALHHPKSSPKLLFKPLIFSSPSSVYHHTRISLSLKKFHSPTKPSIVASSSQHNDGFSIFSKEHIISAILGSLIFIGCWKRRPAPVIAQTVQTSEEFEVKNENPGGKGESEEELMCVKLLERNPRDVEALKTVVNVKIKKRKTGEAVKYVERLIEVQPNEMEWRLLQAFCYEMMGNLSKAKRLFKTILKQKPLLLRALHGLAMVMHKNREGAAVFEMLEKALDVAHKNNSVNEMRNIRILIAQMNIMKGNMEQALEKLQALVHENPRDFRPYLCQGIVYSLLEKRKEADENFEMYRSLVPQEFPQRGFLDDVVLAAKTESKQQLQNDLNTM